MTIPLDIFFPSIISVKCSSSPRVLTSIFKSILFLNLTGMLDCIAIVGSLEERADITPGTESSKTIEFLLSIPLRLIAFK